MKNLIRFIKTSLLLLLGILSSASCDFSPFLSNSSFDTEAVASGKATIVARMTLTAEPVLAEPTNAAGLENTATTEVQCAYAWTVNPDSELTAQLQASMPQSMQSTVQLGVAWYGENCIDIQTNQIVRYSAMDMEITVSYPKLQTQSAAWMGEQIEQLMTLMISELEKNPQWTSYPKVFHFIFNQPGETVAKNFDLDQYLNSKEKNGLSGEALYQALGN